MTSSVTALKFKRVVGLVVRIIAFHSELFVMTTNSGDSVSDRAGFDSPTTQFSSFCYFFFWHPGHPEGLLLPQRKRGFDLDACGIFNWHSQFLEEVLVNFPCSFWVTWHSNARRRFRLMKDTLRHDYTLQGLCGADVWEWNVSWLTMCCAHSKRAATYIFSLHLKSLDQA